MIMQVSGPGRRGSVSRDEKMTARRHVCGRTSQDFLPRKLDWGVQEARSDEIKMLLCGKRSKISNPEVGPRLSKPCSVGRSPGTLNRSFRDVNSGRMPPALREPDHIPALAAPEIECASRGKIAHCVNQYAVHPTRPHLLSASVARFPILCRGNVIRSIRILEYLSIFRFDIGCIYGGFLVSHGDSQLLLR